MNPLVLLLLLLHSASSTYYVVPMMLFEEEGNKCSESVGEAISNVLSKIRWVGLAAPEECTPERNLSLLKRLGASGVLIRDRSSSSISRYTNSSSLTIIPITESFYRHLLRLFYLKGGASPSHSLEKSFPQINLGRESRSLLEVPAFQLCYVAFLVIMVFLFPVIFHKLDEYDGSSLRVIKPRVLFKMYSCRANEYRGEMRFEECSICLERFSEESLLRPLECGHYFHLECIDPWLLNRSNRCPICKQEIDGGGKAGE
jgi:Ring finger domain